MTRQERRKLERMSKNQQKLVKNNILNSEVVARYIILSTENIEKLFDYIARMFFKKNLCANQICFEYKGEKNIIHTIDYGENVMNTKIDIYASKTKYAEELMSLYKKSFDKAEEEEHRNDINKQAESGVIYIPANFIKANNSRQAHEMLYNYIVNYTTGDDFELLDVA